MTRWLDQFASEIAERYRPEGELGHGGMALIVRHLEAVVTKLRDARESGTTRT